VADPSDLTLFYEARTSAGIVPPTNACTTMVFSSCLDHLDDFGPEVGDGPRKAAPNLFKAAADGTTLLLP